MNIPNGADPRAGSGPLLVAVTRLLLAMLDEPEFLPTDDLATVSNRLNALARRVRAENAEGS